MNTGIEKAASANILQPVPPAGKPAQNVVHTAALAGFVLLALCRYGGVIAAGPSVTELLAVCDRAFSQGNRGRDAAACEWFAAPCACRKDATGADMPSWCVPPDESTEDVVRKVVSELRRHPYPAADADRVVREIMGKVYPCGTPRREK